MILKDDQKVDKSEKEEGELSPNCEFEENLVEFKEDGGKALLKEIKHIDERENHSANGEETRNLVCGVGNGAEADDEDSGNVSVRGDISGSESAGMAIHDVTVGEITTISFISLSLHNNSYKGKLVKLEKIQIYFRS